MQLSEAVALILCILLLMGCTTSSPSSTPSPTPVTTVTSAPTPSATPTATPTPTVAFTPEPTPTPSPLFFPSMAFILVENSGHRHTQNEIDRISLLKERASEQFSIATRGKASLDTSYPVVVLSMENNPSPSAIAKKFYESNPDSFHFLTIYNLYDDSGTMYHTSVINRISGIGLGISDLSNTYGSNGQLLGINWMKAVGLDEEDELSTVLSVNGILHETSHQWGAYINFIDENGQNSTILRNPYNPAHWDKKLETGYDLLDGFSWQNNGDGTFTAKLISDYREGYSDLDLYLMGLISEDEVGPITLIVSDADTKDIQPGTTINGTAKTISIQQIIDANGPRSGRVLG